MCLLTNLLPATGDNNRVGARILVNTGAISWRFYCQVMVQQFGSEDPSVCWGSVSRFLNWLRKRISRESGLSVKWGFR